MQSPSEQASIPAAAVSDSRENSTRQNDVGALWQSALGTASATWALAHAESRLAYKSLWRVGLCTLLVCLLALSSWGLLCAMMVASAHVLGLSWLGALALLWILHVIAIFFIVRYLRGLMTHIGFAHTRAQLSNIARALNAN